ncbi:MAG: small basic protein [Pirellulaceae bacterium]
MTIDKSLKIQAGSTKQRNVLTRTERLAQLIETDRWAEGDSIYGLPKVRVQKISMKKKKKVKKVEEDEAAEATGDDAANPAAS